MLFAVSVITYGKLCESGVAALGKFRHQPAHGVDTVGLALQVHVGPGRRIHGLLGSGGAGVAETHLTVRDQGLLEAAAVVQVFAAAILCLGGHLLLREALGQGAEGGGGVIVVAQQLVGVSQLVVCGRCFHIIWVPGQKGVERPGRLGVVLEGEQSPGRGQAQRGKLRGPGVPGNRLAGRPHRFPVLLCLQKHGGQHQVGALLLVEPGGIVVLELCRDDVASGFRRLIQLL